MERVPSREPVLGKLAIDTTAASAMTAKRYELTGNIIITFILSLSLSFCLSVCLSDCLSVCLSHTHSLTRCSSLKKIRLPVVVDKHVINIFSASSYPDGGPTAAPRWPDSPDSHRLFLLALTADCAAPLAVSYCLFDRVSFVCYYRRY